ncbi:hypothetical protein SALWKB2_0286 [Snodgrassella alvi wkB2]|nr:hypothetical protein SALWKB2_0286 [Snodgrassella alvi wkB2]
MFTTFQTYRLNMTTDVIINATVSCSVQGNCHTNPVQQLTIN